MTTPDKEMIIDYLRAIEEPGGKGDIISRGMVSDIFIADRKVFFSLSVPADMAASLEPFRYRVQEGVAQLEGVRSVMVALTAEKRGGGMEAAVSKSRPAQSKPAPPPKATASRAPQAKQGIEGVGAIIAVASGKGGVGKSTTAANIALALKAQGLKVGLMDADIYGPSVPRLLGLFGKPDTVDGKRIVPHEAYGIKAMSMGFMLEEDTPVVWRGPMVISAITQLLYQVEWAPLDVMVVDMPPGTGDAQLTLAQKVPLAGAVIVSTPQDLALIDARKGIAMFQKVDVPILGIVENMSYFIAPDTGNRYDIFGNGGAEREARRIGVPFLGAVPITIALREGSDEGRPIVATQPQDPAAQIYLEIGRQIASRIASSAQPAAPKIIFE
ncbi:Mrp/NBP35 family ATP-binding protein [Limoniibacter endophyticus]|uniref:Iron-sulfur cluster carrier protein n=1 Tax=Limoniibacter endophyticus TaxID=1565040 RepID=A0A8J3DT65_9HYPH|nr:Mrp/NBP35 family ATP-binding protein [Limoniibacter endophyticus]GHC80067.1 iron-sulfur cluster carrier protein [Limoniibacter endophyticus]